MAPAELTHRLSPLDASFLYFERPTQPTHVGCCLIHEGHLAADEFMQLLLDRLHLIPRYRQKVVFPPFGLAHPTWEDDPAFDIRRHVTERMLPAPGDDRVLSEVGGQVFAGMLDRSRPLWQVTLLHGHESGHTASIWKIHHAMVDGVSTVELFMAIHDLRRDAAPPARSATPWQPAPAPDPLTLFEAAVRDNLTEAVQTWTDQAFQPLRPAAVRQLTEALASAPPPQMLQPAPPTPWNRPISGARQLSWLEMPFAAIRSIRGALGGTVNDVVLAILAGGLGRYLRRHGYRTEGVELRAMCPVSMRRAEQRGALGNQVSMLVVPLYVGLADPVERLRAERAAVDQLKEQDQAGRLYALSQFGSRVPAAWQMLAGLLPPPAGPAPINLVASNVPGPQIPLYLGGRRLLHLYPGGIPAANMGLFAGIMSYNQALTIGLTVDPTLVPDVWDAIADLREAYEELRAAAERADAASDGAASPPRPAPARAAEGRGGRQRQQAGAAS